MEFLSLKDYVYEYIAEEISNGNLKPDEKISEKSICDKLNISRTPVREALIQLSSEGLLENVPRKGFITRILNIDEAKEVYEILGTLDGLAAALACKKLKEEDLNNMQFYVDSIDIAIESSNYNMYYKQQTLFHDVYTNLCGNNNLIITINKFKRKFFNRTYAYEDGNNVKEILHEINEEHKEMLRLFKLKDEKAIEEYTKNIHWDRDKAYIEINI